MKIYEVWSEVHQSEEEMLILVKNTLRNEADVELKDGIVYASMYMHVFLDKFAYSGISDKLLSMESKLSTLGFNSDSYKSLHNKLTKLYQHTINKAINVARSLTPYGWVIESNIHTLGLYDLGTGKIELQFMKDINDEDEKVETYYHVTSLKNLDSITNKGLIPKSNTRTHYHGYRNRIYLLKYNPIDDYGMMRELVNKNENESIAIMKVSVPSDLKTYKDPEASQAVYVEKMIPAENISVIYTGRLRDIRN